MTTFSSICKIPVLIQIWQFLLILWYKTRIGCKCSYLSLWMSITYFVMIIEDLFLYKIFAKTTISFIVIDKCFEIQTKTNYITSTKGLTLQSYVNTHACQFREKKYAATLTIFNVYKIYYRAQKSFNFNWQFTVPTCQSLVIIWFAPLPTVSVYL